MSAPYIEGVSISYPYSPRAYQIKVGFLQMRYWIADNRYRIKVSLRPIYLRGHFPQKILLKRFHEIFRFDRLYHESHSQLRRHL